MPNHVINELIFRDVTPASQALIVAATCNDAGTVDFSVLVPEPLNIWWGSVGSEHTKAFGDTSLDWARRNWGTKWNAYSHKPHEATHDTLALRFETAWGPPYPWLAAILNKLKLPFEHNWLDEGASRGRSGKFTIDERWGNQWKEVETDDLTHRHLHKLHWGVEEFEDEQ